MPKNKTPKNAFYFFMQELVPILKREGRVFPGGMADVVPIAHPRFKALSEEEKERFENMAKEYKKRQRGQVGDAHRVDSIGQVVAHRRNKVEDYNTARAKEARMIAETWPTHCDDITDVLFHVINVQSLCKTEDGNFLPVELGVAEYSMRTGIKRVYHTFLKPPAIPMGMRYTCTSNSEDTHKIDVAGHPDATDNLLSVCNILENFVNPQGKLPKYPPFYAMREDFELIDWTLEWIHQHSQSIGARKIWASELEEIVAELWRHSEDPDKVPSPKIVTECLTMNRYDYYKGLKCSFHEDLECRYCALGIPKMICYNMSELLNTAYTFELLANRHLPTRREEPAFESVMDPAWHQAPIPAIPKHAQTQQYRTPNAPPGAPRLGAAPAPVLRPPGAPSIDYRSFQQPFNPPPMVAHTMRAPTPAESLASYDISDGENSAYKEAALTDPAVMARPSSNTSLSRGRVSTWNPMKSGSSWSRTSTPMSTPRATPLPTPSATPLATPKHSPPRPGGMWNTVESGGASRQPPGLARSFEQEPPRLISGEPSAGPSSSGSPNKLQASFSVAGQGFGASTLNDDFPSLGGRATGGSQPFAQPHTFTGQGLRALTLNDDFPSLGGGATGGSQPFAQPHTFTGRGRGRGAALL